VNELKLPGFTAHSSLSSDIRNYQTSPQLAQVSDIVLPAAEWNTGSSLGECISNCNRDCGSLDEDAPTVQDVRETARCNKECKANCVKKFPRPARPIRPGDLLHCEYEASLELDRCAKNCGAEWCDWWGVITGLCAVGGIPCLVSCDLEHNVRVENCNSIFGRHPKIPSFPQAFHYPS
jgi:hypothetical protein